MRNCLRPPNQYSPRCAPVLHLGPSGAGTTMKLVVNTLLGVGMQAIAEAVVLGESAGLNRKLLLEGYRTRQ